MTGQRQISHLDNLEWIRKSKKLLNALNIGFLLQDMDDNILEVNEALLKMSGRNREEFIGHNVSQFYSEKEYKALRTGDLLQIDSEYYQGEYFIYNKDGTRIPVLFIVSINKNELGEPVSENVLVLDISKQKQFQARLKEANKELTAVNEALRMHQDSLQNEKMKLEAILFGIGDSVSVFDINGRHLLSNPQAHGIHKKKRSVIPLEACRDQIVTLGRGNKQRHFEATVKEVKDSQGETFAFVEILKETTDQVALRAREQELQLIKRQLRQKTLASEILSTSPAMDKCINAALLCADLESTVLITGETGVGKNMVAAAIHNHSGRRNRPFVQVNCGALPENLIESELFGHVRGSFSGAVSDNIGLFRTADGGTLFLDEVGDLGMPLQVKLLHAIQDREIRPVGSNRTYKIDVRLVCATNRNLKGLVEKGLFRQDLYYRLAVIPLMIPPLRERRQDILLLANHFIGKHSKKSRQKTGFHHDTQRILLEYHWPGNVRELENVIEYALAMSPGPLILPEHLPVFLLTVPEAVSPRDPEKEPAHNVIEPDEHHDSLAESEKEAILDALWRCKFNQSRAAKELGISRVTLWRKMSRYRDLQ
jgi:PAS domain S-box-containing protein